MTPDLGSFLRAVGDTVRDPATMARQIAQMRLPHEVGWMGLAAVIALTVVVLVASQMLLGSSTAAVNLGSRPFVDAILIGAMTVILIFVLYFGGRAMGGTGTFGGTLLVMTWFQAVVLVLVVIQLVATFIAPALGAFAALIVFGIQLYCLIHFLNELHGFNSLPKAAGLFVLALLGIAFGLAVMLTLIGGAAAVGGVQ